MIGGGSFCLPHNLFPSTSLYSIYFSSPNTICFKNRTFLLPFTGELHVERWSRRFFSLLTRNSDITAIDISELARVLLSAWSGHSERCSCLPAAHADCSRRLHLMVISVNWCTWPCNIVQQETTSMKLRKPL